MAVMDFTDGLRTGPENLDLFSGRGEAYRQWGEEQAARGIDPRPVFRKAVADFDGAVRINPMDGNNYNDRGVSLISLGDAMGASGEDPRETYRKALADIRKALELDPGIAPAHNNLGEAYSRLADGEGAAGADSARLREKAVEAFRRAAHWNPDWWEVWANLGSTLESLGRVGEAVRCYEKALSLTDRPPPSLREQLRQARSRLAKAVYWPRIRSDLQRGVSAYEREDFVAAKIVLEKVLLPLAGARPNVPPDVAPLLVRGHYRLARILALEAAGEGSPWGLRQPDSKAGRDRRKRDALSQLQGALSLGGVSVDPEKLRNTWKPLRRNSTFGTFLEEVKSIWNRDK
jgi:tetratricopeptide (TPR) repeat protein